MTVVPLTEFAEHNPIMSLSQHDVAEAIEFWLNSLVLKHPCKVTGLKTGTQFGWVKFDVALVREKLKMEDYIIPLEEGMSAEENAGSS